VLVKLDELDSSWGFRAHATTGVADTERMKTEPLIRRHGRRGTIWPQGADGEGWGVLLGPRSRSTNTRVIVAAISWRASTCLPLEGKFRIPRPRSWRDYEFSYLPHYMPQGMHDTVSGASSIYGHGQTRAPR
jgi:hypothetical protein